MVRFRAPTMAMGMVFVAEDNGTSSATTFPMVSGIALPS